MQSPWVYRFYYCNGIQLKWQKKKQKVLTRAWVTPKVCLVHILNLTVIISGSPGRAEQISTHTTFPEYSSSPKSQISQFLCISIYSDYCTKRAKINSKSQCFQITKLKFRLANIYIDPQKHFHILHQSLWKTLIKSTNSLFFPNRSTLLHCWHKNVMSHVIQTKF